MNKKWTRTAWMLIVAMLLCVFALPALSETDATLNAFTKYAKVLQGKGSSFKDGLPEVFEGKAVIAVYYDLNADPLELSTKLLAEEGDYWMIPEEFLAKSIKEADWAILVYVSDEDYGDEGPEVSCFAVDINKGVYYAPYDIYDRDTYIGNDERTYELSGTLSGIDESVLYQTWKAKNGGQQQRGEEKEESEFDSYYLQGLEYMKEEKYYSAYEAFLDSDSAGAYEMAQKCIQTWPKNGEVWRSSTAKGDPYELSITVNQSDDSATFLRCLRKGFPISYVFIRGTGTVKITIPVGVYSIKVASGTDWFGLKEAFGPYGSYASVTDQGKEEYRLASGYYGTLEINTNSPGGIPMKGISWEGFTK